jgi:hypothetical protein
MNISTQKTRYLFWSKVYYYKFFKKILSRIGRYCDFISPLVRGNVAQMGIAARVKQNNIDELIKNHFLTNSEINHPCIPTLSLALKLLNQKKAIIVETGSSAWGTNSTLLFDQYCNSFGGQLDTVDIRLQPLINLKFIVTNKTKINCDDSIAFLLKYDQGDKIDLLYLDSWDVDWQNPIQSCVHGLHEFLSISRSLRNGALVLIDDTPVDPSVMEKVQPKYLPEFLKFKEKYGFYPGKGALVKQLIQSTNKHKIISHEYQFLFSVQW